MGGEIKENSMFRELSERDLNFLCRFLVVADNTYLLLI